jgi:histidinol dehydrogenase
VKVVAASDSAALRELLGAGWSASPAIVAEVADILDGVRKRGDTAVGQRARVAIPMVQSARASVPREIAAGLELARERIARFHERQRQPDVSYVEEDGTRYATQRRPLHSVAVYASRVGAALAVLMGAVPAKIAGVPRIVVFSPPGSGGPSPALLFACALCGVDELYAIGGAQAIAAAAFGTESIDPVDKIVGRAGVHATEAKRQVFGRCGIDMLAGHAEVLVVADDGASSEYVAGEMLAVAELPGVTRLAVLSESRSLLEAVAQLIDTLDLRTLERHEFVGGAIATHCRLIEARDRDELFDLANRIAPAYLSLQVRDASAYVERIHAAGAVFVGDMTPVVSGEYLAGTSGVVPTSGTARWASTLSLADFTRTFVVLENTVERIATDAPTMALLADFDSLPHHAQTARMRCER